MRQCCATWGIRNGTVSSCASRRKSWGLRRTDILNVKCSPLETGSLRQKPGIFPAYHMNKTHWITILLDGTLPEPELFWLLDESYTLTMPKPRKRKEVHP